jgi:hypothetical protein
MRPATMGAIEYEERFKANISPDIACYEDSLTDP